MASISFNPLMGARVSAGGRAVGPGKSIRDYRGRKASRNPEGKTDYSNCSAAIASITRWLRRG